MGRRDIERGKKNLDSEPFLFANFLRIALDWEADLEALEKMVFH